MVFQYALQKILDAAAGTSLGLETSICLAPNLHRFNLRDGRAGEKAFGTRVRATQQVGKLLPVIFGHVFGGQHVPRDHDAERSARKQLPKRVLGNKTVHNVLPSKEKAHIPADHLQSPYGVGTYACSHALPGGKANMLTNVSLAPAMSGCNFG